MKRRVFSKTTPFHTFKKQKKKKKEQNGVVLKRHCSSSSPDHAAGKKEKRLLFFEFLPATLAWSPPTGHNGRPPTAHHPPNLGSRAQWPTSRLPPMRAVKNSVLGLYK
jgi:hypothetical protein